MNGRYTDITLIKWTEAVNDTGDWVKTEVRRVVYAEERSVGQTEFYQGFAVGFKPEVKFILTNFMDYQGEKVVEYVPFMGDAAKPVRLTILRTFNAGDTLELTCYKSVETDDGATTSDATTTVTEVTTDADT